MTRHDALYGVPIRFSLDPDVEAEAPTIDVKQTRYDARAEVPLSGFFNQLRLRGGYAEYRHNEIEDTGEIASTFRTSGGEGGAEIVEAERGGWGGTSGVQYFKRKVRIDGEEKFLPRLQAAPDRGCSRCRAWSGASCGSRAASALSSASWTRMRMPTLGRPR